MHNMIDSFTLILVSICDALIVSSFVLFLFCGNFYSLSICTSVIKVGKNWSYNWQGSEKLVWISISSNERVQFCCNQVHEQTTGNNGQCEKTNKEQNTAKKNGSDCQYGS